MWKPNCFHDTTKKTLYRTMSRIASQRAWYSSPVAVETAPSRRRWGAEDLAPDDRRDDLAEREGREERHAHERPAAEILVEQEGEEERERELQQQRQHEDDDVVRQRAAEDLVLERGREVREADEVRELPEAVPLVEAVARALDDGVDRNTAYSKSASVRNARISGHRPACELRVWGCVLGREALF